MTRRPGRPPGRTLLTATQLEARHRAIAKLRDRPVVRFWPVGLYPHWMGDPFRTPIEHLPGQVLQRAAAENA